MYPDRRRVDHGGPRGPRSVAAVATIDDRLRSDDGGHSDDRSADDPVEEPRTEWQAPVPTLVERTVMNPAVTWLPQGVSDVVLLAALPVFVIERSVRSLGRHLRPVA